ncbi:MAG: hypothetical protein Q7S76_02375 [bacterium]|nr:hypothetical protein [bacterium]
MNQRSINLPKKHLLITAGIIFFTLFATGVVLLSFRFAKNRSSTIVLPGGRTYLGPESEPTKGSTQTLTPEGKIPIDSDSAWSTQHGSLYPYSFSYPRALQLGVFPDDPFDAVTIFWGDMKPQENVFIRIEDLAKIPQATEYIGKPAKLYAENWWRQYSYWKGVSGIEEFMNSKGLKGYRAHYKDSAGNSPFEHVFFEVPQRNDLVIWVSSKLLDKKTFDALVDSVAWVPK